MGGKGELRGYEMRKLVPREKRKSNGSCKIVEGRKNEGREKGPV
jgi:hypothetical protein